MRVLYVVPDSADDPALALHGSTKDVACLQSYFDARRLSVTRVAVPRRNRDAIARLEAIDIPAHDLVVLSMPGSYPRLLRWLRIRAPHSRVMFRAHNAEALHRLDWLRASAHWTDRLRLGVRAARAAAKDLVTVHAAAHAVLSISDADTQQYWHPLGAGRRVVTVPYFMPHTPRVDTAMKDDLCVCIGALAENPLVLDAVRNFCSLVDQQTGSQLSHWRFVLIGSSGSACGSRGVESLGLLRSPFDALARARAVALLSDYGRGFKTKILEALHAHCRILVAPGLYGRLPPAVRPFCIAVRTDSPDDFRAALERCREPWPAGDANEALRREAFAALDELLALPEPAMHATREQRSWESPAIRRPR